MAVKRVLHGEFRDEYSRVREWLLAALSTQLGGGDEGCLLRDLGSKRYQLCTSENAACVTELCEVDGVEVCLLLLVAGKQHDALDEVLGEGQETIEQWAKERGCKGLYGIGRPEWRRVLVPHGFKVVSMNYYKEF
ncbi:hypothetical protein ACQKGL_02145 [Ensifer adhaerens]|uniref:hypothetical protein n=1 Tax=Ensifer adhaerens TaxID=106592 RepID=UPI003D02DD74